MIGVTLPAYLRALKTLKSRPCLFVCRVGVVRRVTTSLIASRASRHMHTAAPTILEERRNSTVLKYVLHEISDAIYKPSPKATTFSLHRLYTITVAFPMPPELATPFRLSSASKF